MLISFNIIGILSPGKSQHCCPAFLLPFSEPGIELLPYSFSCLKRPTNLSLSAIQELFLPPSPKISACSLIVLCTSVQRMCYIMGCSTPGFPVQHQLTELAQTHVHQVVRESVPRQVDKESRGPQGERGLEFSRRKKGQTFSYSTFLRIISQ